MIMPFGKHKGKHIAQCPHDYLLWLLDNATKMSPTLKTEIRKVLGIGEPPDTIPSLAELEAQLDQLFKPKGIR